MKFRTELFRIVKFILITGTVNVVFALVNTTFFRSAAASNIASSGVLASASSWGFTIVTTLITTLLNRYFTFRATEKWYIALPVMLAAAIAWQILRSYPLAVTAQISMQASLNMSTLLGFVWMALQYLLQRCVIYCHTTDTNGWYARFHPTNDE